VTAGPGEAPANAGGVGSVLDGIVVVELGGFVAVPAACAYLADLGARVVKVEAPGKGDAMRHGRRWAGGEIPFSGDDSLMFAEINRHKEFVSLDLRQAEGVETMKSLLGKADVFVTNMRQPSLERLGLWHEQLAVDLPQLVYLHLTGYGHDGPERSDRSFDMAAQARSGLMSLLGRDGEPFTFHLAVDQLASVSAAWGVTLALLARATGHPGTRVLNTSLLGASMDFLRVPILMSQANGASVRFPDRDSAPVATLNAYGCADGRWIALCVGIASNEYWPRLCEALERPDLLTDPAFCSADARKAHAGQVVAELDSAFAERPAAEWAARLRTEGFPAAVVASPLEAVDDPQATLNFVERTEFEGFGAQNRITFPIGDEVDSFPAARPISSAPVGGNTDEVLADLLGYEKDQLTALREAGVIGS
jgi:crotonobetainyl-CoA:carnitine CoA-transferase CaiB-like acyl-CoA transferase